MTAEISKSKYALKTNCVHYAYSRCKVLNSTQTGKLNCELCKCSFFETKGVYNARQAKAKNRGVKRQKNNGRKEQQNGYKN